MSKIDLNKSETTAGDKIDKDNIKAETIKLKEKIQLYQRKMYAEGNNSLLIVLQWMDASGKDGTVKRIFTWTNPLGCRVQGFKKPTPLEAAHDFLWRVHQHAPEAGMIKIFNRSHYEDVLVPAVEWYKTKKEIEKRYEDINNFEQLLVNNGTTVLKFYLNISHDRQKEKLLDRINNPEKYWKHNDGDRESRAKWDQYMDQYHEVFKGTDTKHAPWHIIAADQNWWKVYQVAKVIVEAFEKMNPHWPELEGDVSKFLEEDDD